MKHCRSHRSTSFHLALRYLQNLAAFAFHYQEFTCSSSSHFRVLIRFNPDKSTSVAQLLQHDNNQHYLYNISEVTEYSLRETRIAPVLSLHPARWRKLRSVTWSSSSPRRRRQRRAGIQQCTSAWGEKP